MHCARRAPELSATVSIVRSWIIVHSRGPFAAPCRNLRSLLGPLHELDEPPALVLRHRARLHEADHVALFALVVLVVHLELAALADVPADRRVLDQTLDHHDARLVHLVRHDLADANLAATAVVGRALDLCGHPLVPPLAVLLCSSSVITRAMSRRVLRILSELSSCRIELRKR